MSELKRTKSEVPALSKTCLLILIIIIVTAWFVFLVKKWRKETLCSRSLRCNHGFTTSHRSAVIGSPSTCYTGIRKGKREEIMMTILAVLVWTGGFRATHEESKSVGFFQMLAYHSLLFTQMISVNSTHYSNLILMSSLILCISVSPK